MTTSKGLGRFAGIGLETVQAGASAPTDTPETRMGEAQSTAAVVEAAPTSVVEESPSVAAPPADSAPTSQVEDPAGDVATAAAPTTDAENSEVGEAAKSGEEAAAAAQAANSNEDLKEDLEGNEEIAAVEEELVGVEESAGAVSESSNDVEVMSDAAAALEAIAATLETSLESGGLDNLGVEMMHHAVNANVRKLDIDCSPVASMECFSDGSRMQATTVSLESLRDWITRIWKAIKEAIVKLRRTISEFFMKLRTAAPTVEKAAVALKARAMKLDKDAKPKHPKFVFKGKYVLSKEDGGVLGTLKKAGEGIKAIDGWIGTQKKLSGEIVKVIKAVDVSSEDALIGSLAGVHGTVVKSTEKVDLGGGRTLEVPELEGGKEPNSLREVAEAMNEVAKIKAVYKDEGSASVRSVEIDLLSPEGITGVLDAIIGCSQLVAKGVDVVKERDDLIEAGDSLEKKVAGEDLSPDAVAALSAALKLSSAVSDNIGKPADAVYLHAMQVCRELLNVAKLALDSY